MAYGLQKKVQWFHSTQSTHEFRANAFVFHSFLMQISGICYIERRRRKMFSKVIVDDSQSDLVEVHRFTFVAVIWNNMQSILNETKKQRL